MALSKHCFRIMVFRTLVSLFLVEPSGKALTLHKSITCDKFLYIAHYLAELMGHPCILSKMYQKGNIVFTGVNPFLQATIDGSIHGGGLDNFLI